MTVPSDVRANIAPYPSTLAIYGPGGFGRELIPIATQDGRETCFISDSETDIGGEALGRPIYRLEQLRTVHPGASIVIAVADAAVRRSLAAKVAAAGLAIGSAIADSAIVGPGVTIGEGAILCHFAIVTASARIGRHFHANLYSYVAHDCVIGDYVTLAPRACVNGNIVIEDDVYVGTGAVLRQGAPGRPLHIGRGATIGMGAIVTRDVAPGTTVVGNPARILERG